MSIKYVVAAAAIAAVAVTETDAYRPAPPVPPHKFDSWVVKEQQQAINRPTHRLMDQEQADWTVNAGISGQAGQRPNWNVGVGVKWDEEQTVKSRPTLLNKKRAQQQQHHAAAAAAAALLDEEQADWEFNAGISGQVGQPPSWNVGIGVKWDEEEQALSPDPSDRSLDKKLIRRCGPNVPRGYCNPFFAKELFDEEQADWSVNAGIQGGAGGRPQWHVNVGAKWDEEQSWQPDMSQPYWQWRPMDEEQALPPGSPDSIWNHGPVLRCGPQGSRCFRVVG